MFPPNGSVTQHSLPSPGSRWHRFPCFDGTTECSDFSPSLPPHFVAFVWRYHAVRLVVRSWSAQGAQPTGPGSLRFGHPAYADLAAGDDEISQVPGEPSCACARFLDPGETDLPGPYSRLARPHAQGTAGALHER